MSRWLTLALLLVALCGATQAYRRTRRCYSQRLERYFKDGDEWRVPGCRVARCVRGRAYFSKCEPVAADPPQPGCQLLKGDPTADHPDCCERWLCPEPGQCVAPVLQRLVPVGHRWTEPPCARAECTEHGVGAVGCPAFPTSPGCSVEPGVPGGEYPTCCPRENCTEAKPCYDKYLDRRFAVGERWTLPECSGAAECEEGGAVSAVGCPLSAVAPGVPCALDDGELGLEYPQCCPKITCPDCYSQKLERYFGPGDEWTDEGCILNRCTLHENGSVGVSRLPCGLLGPPPASECWLVAEDSAGEYPGCCAHFVCPNHYLDRATDRWFAVGEKSTEEDCTQSECIQASDGAAKVIQLPLPSDGCFSERHQRFFQPGETFTGPGCSRATCREGGGISGVGCGLIGVPPHYQCALDDGEPGLEYPQCCPKITCSNCYSRKLERYFGPGDEWTDEGCTLSRCNVHEDGSVEVSQLPCGLLGPPPAPDCQIVEEDPSGDYPHCCATFRCRGHCFSRSQHRWIAVGEGWAEAGCTRFECTQTDAFAQISSLFCPFIGLDDLIKTSCRFVEGDAASDYPQCCHSVQCEPPPEEPHIADHY
ncbi:uncharacterized protein LOC119091461 [Pollicipes pollicipes]|uniref:uncharacterized protein LOC119091461 n=1 Tax=Pollicipes pollicipes TaxID=41117 RepID=UPI001885081B|nr:uncharacterized protein LOC119091461 [Pollicipes pollicipes]